MTIPERTRERPGIALNRILLAAGAAVCLGAAAAMVLLGPATLKVFEYTMTFKITSDGPAPPLPGTFGQIQVMPLLVSLYGLGLMAACVAFGLPSERRSLSLTGRILAALSGLCIAFSALPLLIGCL